MRILFICNSSTNHRHVVQMLQDEFTDLEVEEASSPADLERSLEQPPPDLVLTGSRLTWADGLQVLQQIRARFSHLPVLMIAKAEDEATALQGMQDGLSDYLLAEYPARLPLAIRSCLERARREREGEEATPELQAVERRYRAIVNRIADMAYAFRVEPDGKLVPEWQGGEITPLTGYTWQELEDRGGWTSVIHPDDRSIFLSYLPRLLAGEPTTAQVRIVTRTGEVRWLQVSDQPEWDSGRVVRVCGGAKDITARRLAEEELQRRSAELEAVMASIADGFIHYDIQGRVIRSNEAALQASGTSESDRSVPYDQHVRNLQVRVGEEQRPADPAELPARRALRGETVCDELISWQRQTDGRRVWVLMSSAPIRLPDGQLLGAVTTFSDVTRLRETQQQLEQAGAALQKKAQELEAQSKDLQKERDFNSAVLDTAGALVVVLDREGRILRFNRACEQLTGYTWAEVQGRAFWDLFLLPEEVVPVRTIFEKLRAGHFPSYNENHWVTRYGTRRLIQWSNTVVLDAGGQVEYVVETGIDITERRRSEAEREQMLAQSEALNRTNALLSSSLHLDATLQQILLEAARYLGVGKALLTHRESGGWKITYGYGLEAAQIGNLYPDEQTDVSAYVEKTREVLVINDIEQDHRFKAPWIKKYGLGSLLVVPLLCRGQVTGAMYFSGHAAPVPFSKVQIDFARKLATAIALAQENAALYAALLRDAETKAVLLREINHRVKNNLAAIVGLLYTKLDRPGVTATPEYQTAIQDVVRQVEGLSIVHGMLSATQWSSLQLNELTEQIVSFTLQAVPVGQVAIEVKASPVRVSSSQAHILAIVVNELAANVAKHALTDAASRVAVDISQEGESVVLVFEDNGPGYPEDVITGQRRGTGLGLLESMIHHNLHGEMTLRNQRGAVAEIRFPLEATAE